MTLPESSTQSALTAEQSGTPAEVSLIIQNFNQLTVDIVRADTERMLAEADRYLCIAAGEATPDEATPQTPEVGEAVATLDALSSAFSALGLEVDDDAGIIQYLMRDVGPQAIREEAGKQQVVLQTASDNVFAPGSPYSRIYDRLQTFDAAVLDTQDQQRLDYYIKRFEDARRQPSGETAAEIAEIQKELDDNGRAFAKNRANLATIYLTQEEFNSLPANTRNQLRATASDDGLAVRLSQPNLTYILQNAPRALRSRAYSGFYGDRVEGNDRLLELMVGERAAIAEAGGKGTWLTKQTEGLTLGTPQEVLDFYASYEAMINPRYEAAINRLRPLFEADGISDIQEYDLPYYEKKFIETCYDVNEVTFTLTNTIEGLLKIAAELYDVDVKEITDAPVWADGVKAYIVHDATTGETIGTFYTDLGERKDPDGQSGKLDGGVTYALRYAKTRPGADGKEETIQLPIAVAVANVAPKTSDGQEPKLTLKEIEDVSHEILGHAFPIMFGRTRGPEFGGDKVKFDVREMNSQMWQYVPRDANILSRFVDPGASEEAMRRFVENLSAAQEVRVALDSMRMLKVMRADLELHNTTTPNLSTALERSGSLIAPVTTDGHWIRAQIHMSNRYAGRYFTYPYCDEQGGKIAQWLHQNNYSQVIGKQLRAIQQLGGRPGATERQVAFAAQLVTAAVGGTALEVRSSE